MRRWLLTPLVTITRLLGAMKAHQEGRKGLSSTMDAKEVDGIINMLNARLAERQQDSGAGPSGGS